jgi:hypothetical protein
MKFLNKESYQFANWGRFQPNTRGRNVNKHCVQVGKNKTWRNKRCDTTTKRFLLVYNNSIAEERTQPNLFRNINI